MDIRVFVDVEAENVRKDAVCKSVSLCVSFDRLHVQTDTTNLTVSSYVSGKGIQVGGREIDFYTENEAKHVAVSTEDTDDIFIRMEKAIGKRQRPFLNVAENLFYDIKGREGVGV